MDLFEKNMSALEKKNKEYADEIRKITIDKISDRIVVSEASNGMQIVSVQEKGHLWNLNSRFDPELAAELYWERYEIPLYGIYFLYGCADGRHLKQCLEKCDDTNRVIICEPDMEAFSAVCHFLDLTGLFKDDRTYWYFPEIREVDIQHIVDEVVSYSQTKLLEFCILPGYDVRFPEKCQRYMDMVLGKVESLMAIKATYLGFNRMIPRHTLFHIKNLIYNCNIEQIKRKLKEYDISGIPAIIVSAGPSLDKNVQELRKAQGKAFIIVVDAALRTLLKAGIRPDIVYTIDPESPDRFFENLNLDGLLWACSRIARPEVIKQYAGKIFYNGLFWGKWNAEISEELGYIFPWLMVGGSVTSEAFQFAAYIGFKKMILVGQDMAFTNGISHTKGIEQAFGDNNEYIESRLLMDVEGNDGTMLKTDYQMYIYKHWFENLFLANKDNYEVINATEGGAKIKGTKIAALKDTIAVECQKKLDIYGILEEIPPMFDREQQERLLGKLKNMPDEVKKFQKHLDEVISKQEKLLKQIENNEISQKELVRHLRELIRQNEEINKEPMRDMVILYAQKEEYQVGEDVYQADLGPKELVEKSLLLLRGYQNGFQLFKEDIEDYIMKD